MSVRTATLQDNIARVQESIAAAAERAGRRADSVKLIAVSKTNPAELVAEVARLGLTSFGENRVQEAAAKIPTVAAQVGRPLDWHLIGTLQRNKVNQALPLFNLIQSVDSPRLAEAIAQRAAAQPVRVLLEVYFGDDPERPGFRPDELPSAFPSVHALAGLEIQGLMTVAPFGLEAARTQAVFAGLRELRDRLVADRPGLELPELSMGMTDDYPLAIAEGATIVRIGRAIFGERPRA